MGLMGTLKVRQPQLTRETLVNPYKEAFGHRLRNSGAVDLRDNARIVPLRGGYDRIVPIDPTKLVR